MTDNCRDRTLIIDGGLGRIITAIPALEKFVQENTNTTILVHGWAPVVYGNKILGPSVFDFKTKGNFERIRNTSISKPEPYYETAYINQQIHLIDAWNRCINNSTDALGIPKIYLSNNEKNNLWNVKTSKKLVAFQPFGSTAYHTNAGVVDNSNRSMSTLMSKLILKRLVQENYDVLLITDKQVPWNLDCTFIPGIFYGPRDLAGAIYQCDYFVGIDSAGQHIARCLRKPGTVVLGSTSAVNISYADFFNIIDTAPDASYKGLRISDEDLYLDEIENADIMDIPLQQLHGYIDSIINHIKTTT